MRHCLTGFGFGPIQAGLFVAEAFGSGRFDRIVISEIDAGLVEAIRKNRGRYSVNVAHADRIEARHIDGVELLNPNDPADHARLSEALAQSTEMVTSLPSVSFYTAGDSRSVAARIADGSAESQLGRRLSIPPRTTTTPPRSCRSRLAPGWVRLSRRRPSSSTPSSAR